ncbi:pilus assembly protein TadG-related protein [Occallatibacter savannae]|uniref:pilus assembly protein TadG-related protein n=1 Tax=Occallatibacter savannae TaxID=1002691 RepID=UPI000D699BD4|nr:pilus assembly protein TadG-related protein [Occallatibacter savannae]
MRILREEKGQVLVMTAFCMACLLGCLGLAVDVGVLFNARRQMQAAADAAAMAAATEAYYNGTSSANIKPRAYAAAAANGVDNSVTGNVVMVTVSPTLQPGSVVCTSCVEVQLSKSSPTIFMATMSQWMFKSNQWNGINVSAMAVAGWPGTSNNCIYLTGAALSSELTMHGGSSINAPGCGVYVNSNKSDAVDYNGNATLTTPSLAIVGNDNSGLPGPTVTSYNAPVQSPPIPLNIPAMPSSGCTSTITATEITVSTTGSGKVTQSAASGSSSNNVVCFSNAVTIDSGVTLSGVAGNGVLYVFQNGVTLSGSVSFGTGTASPSGCIYTCTSFSGEQSATLVLAGGKLNQGNSDLSVFAPTSGTYNSIGLMVPTTNTTWSGSCPASPVTPCMLIQRGSSNSTFDGIVYAPNAYIELQDAGGGAEATGVVSQGLYTKGSAVLNIPSYTTAHPTTSPFDLITLVQ